MARLPGPRSVVKKDSLRDSLLLKSAGTCRPYPEPGTQVQGGCPPSPSSLGLASAFPPLVLTSLSIAERLLEGFPLPLPADIQLSNLVLQTHQVGPNVPRHPMSLHNSHLLPKIPILSTLCPTSTLRSGWLLMNREERVRLGKATQFSGKSNLTATSLL